MVGADLGEALGVAGVAAEIRPVRRPDDRPRRPQRWCCGSGKRPEKCRAGCADQGELVDLGSARSSRVRRCARSGMPQSRRCAPTPSERRTGPHWLRAPATGSVRCRGGRNGPWLTDDRVQGRQRVQGQPAADASVRPDDIRGRNSVPPHRVGENAVPSISQPRRRVAETSLTRDLSGRGLEGSPSGVANGIAAAVSGGGASTDELPTKCSAVTRGRC